VKAWTCCVFALATGLSFSSLVGGASADGRWCGEAAWFEGAGLTASGEVNAAGALSAAHPSLPFGTRVKVDNLGNGRSVVVRVNDRGTFAQDRVILVSRAAAEKLGMIHDGTARVRLSIVDGDRAGAVGCGDEDRIAEEEAPSEPPVVEAVAASELQEESISDKEPAAEEIGFSGPSAREVPPGETIATRFAVAFRPETWQEAELSKAIAAFAPRLAELDQRGHPPAAIPWPALDRMTPIRLTPSLIAYAWSNRLSLPTPTGFERAAAPTRLSQLMQ
jgi:peptidoglycan lytic transglycosylase